MQIFVLAFLGRVSTISGRFRIMEKIYTNLPHLVWPVAQTAPLNLKGKYNWSLGFLQWNPMEDLWTQNPGQYEDLLQIWNSHPYWSCSALSFLNWKLEKKKKSQTLSIGNIVSLSLCQNRVNKFTQGGHTKLIYSVGLYLIILHVKLLQDHLCHHVCPGQEIIIKVKHGDNGPGST